MLELDLIIVDGIAGALSGFVGFLLAKRFVNREEKPQLFMVILITFVVAGSQILPALVNPHIRAWRAERDLQAFLESDPLFRGVLTDHPALRGPLLDRFLEAAVSGKREVSVAAGREILGSVLPEYIARAPNDAVNGFGRTNLEVLERLQSDGDRCFRFVNPTVDGPALLTDEDGRGRLQDAVRAVVVGARENPIGNGASNGELLLQTVSAEVYEVYGEEMGMLAQTEDPNLDRDRYCEILISVYEHVLALPEADSAAVLRFMMGPGSANAVEKTSDDSGEQQ